MAIVQSETLYFAPKRNNLYNQQIRFPPSFLSIEQSRMKNHPKCRYKDSCFRYSESQKVEMALG